MRRRRLADMIARIGLLLVPATAALPVLGAGPAFAATLNVCPSGCPYAEIAPALAAAHDGDTSRSALAPTTVG